MHPEGLFFGGLAADDAVKYYDHGSCQAAPCRCTTAGVHRNSHWLGAHGHMEAIMNASEESPDLGRARAWLGDSVRSTASGEASSAPLYGTLKLALSGMPLRMQK